MTAAGPVPLADGMPDADAVLWYLARGTGTVSLLLLTAVVVLGVLVRRGGTVAGLPRFVVVGLHRNLSLLALAFLSVHVVTVIVDPFAPIRVVDAVLPLASGYRPVWLGLGAVALDLLLAVVITSLLRLRIGRATWRAVHASVFLAWPVALVHGLGTGTDARQSWLLVLCAGCVAAVLAAVLWRVGNLPGLARPQRAALVTVAVAMPAVLTGWLVIGPLAPDWAARSGTPPTLLAAAGQQGGSDDRPTGSATVSGGAREESLDGQTVAVTLSGTLSGGPGGRLRVELRGTSDGRGGVAVNSGTVTLDPASGDEYTGTLDSFDDERLSAVLDGPAGQATFDARVAIDLGIRSFFGSVVIS